MKIFNSLEEMKPYYNEKTNTYDFIKNERWFHVSFDFDVDVKSNIKAKNINAWDINALDIEAGNIKAMDINAGDIIAGDIKAWDIKAGDINAGDIKAWDINALDIEAGNIKARDINAGDIKAGDINFYGVCYAYKNIKCKSIKGSRENAKYFCLDGEVEFVE